MYLAALPSSISFHLACYHSGTSRVIPLIHPLTSSIPKSQGASATQHPLSMWSEKHSTGSTTIVSPALSPHPQLSSSWLDHAGLSPCMYSSAPSPRSYSTGLFLQGYSIFSFPCVCTIRPMPTEGFRTVTLSMHGAITWTRLAYSLYARLAPFPRISSCSRVLPTSCGVSSLVYKVLLASYPKSLRRLLPPTIQPRTSTSCLARGSCLTVCPTRNIDIAISWLMNFLCNRRYTMPYASSSTGVLSLARSWVLRV